MIRKVCLFITVAALTALAGCVKETYNLDTLSKKAQWSPSFGVSAIRGNISLSDLKDLPNDTVVFDEDKFVRLIFRKDSVIEFRMEDYYDLNNMVSFHESYTIGEITLAPFNGSIFPVTSTGEIPFPVFANFVNATLSQGALDITVRNNTTAVINNITITIFNTSPRQQLGAPAVISAINPGQTGSASINLSNLTIIRNHTSAAFVISGGPGMILNGSNLEIAMTGRDMKIRSGRVIVPPQPVYSLDNHDTIIFDPGQDVEIDVIKMNAGNLTYSIINNTPLRSTVALTLRTALQGTDTIKRSLTVNPDSPLNGNISLNNAIIDLGSVVETPFNRLPVDHKTEISSQNNLIDFSSTDQITIDFNLIDPDFDYVKGYFGKKTESIEEDTLDLEEIVSRISGQFHLADPSFTINYRNSFSVPIKIDFKADGLKNNDSKPLNLSPFFISSPVAPGEREKNSFFSVDKNNSDIDDLVSMPPEKVIFSGTAVMNPDGNSGGWNNYIFGDSRFIGDLEVEIPLDFSMNNLQFADTVENFLKNDEPGDDESFNFEDFEYLRLDIRAENGFPLGVSLGLSLYDSVTGDTLCPVQTPGILSPAPVGTNGKVTSPVISETSIVISKYFWDSINDADMIIFNFTLVTTDNGTRDVKIYSDYNIDFRAALVLKLDKEFELK